jgi:hypothetical protein
LVNHDRVPACGLGSAPVGDRQSAPSRLATWLQLALALLTTALLIAGVLHLSRECYWLNFRLYADCRNPYVYAHTSSDIKNLAGALERLARASPEGRNLMIHVVTPDNYWPLPWYLRQFSSERVGYWDDASAWARDVGRAAVGNIPVGRAVLPVEGRKTGRTARPTGKTVSSTRLAACPPPAAIILTPDIQSQVDAALPAAYKQQMMFGLRPDVLVHVYVREDLWQAFIAGHAER